MSQDEPTTPAGWNPEQRSSGAGDRVGSFFRVSDSLYFTDVYPHGSNEQAGGARLRRLTRIGKWVRGGLSQGQKQYP